MRPFVLDVSIAAVWCLRDEQSSLAEHALDEARRVAVLVPALFWYEVRNMVVVNEQRGRLSGDDARSFLMLLGQLNLDQDSDPSSEDVLELARTHKLSVYDTAYLELASRRRAMLATLDRRLAASAEAAGVTLLTL